MEVQPFERRREQQRREARSAILASAEALLLDVGTERFSIRRLAARCGYTAPTIYRHFSDKQRLIDAVLEAYWADLLGRLRQVPRGEDASEYLRALLRTSIRLNLEHPTYYRLLSVPRAEAGSLPSAEEARELVVQVLRELAARGRLATDNIDAATETLWALMHGLISLRIIRPSYPFSKDLDDVALDMLDAGLLRRRPSRTRG